MKNAEPVHKEGYKSLILPIALSSLFILLVGYLSFFGFDITDEGFYLASIASPLSNSGNLSMFGLILNPVFELIGGNVVILRLISLFGLVASGLFFISGLKLSESTVHNLILSTSIAIAALLVLKVWLPTPNYNSLNLMGMMVAAGCICRIGAKRSIDGIDSKWSLWILLGVAGSLIFLVKPTSGAVIGVSTLIFLAGSGNFEFKKTVGVAAIAAIILIAAALISDGSVPGFIERVNTGYTNSKILYGSEWADRNLFWRGKFDLKSLNAVSNVAFLLVLTLVYFLSSKDHNLARLSGNIIIVALVIWCGLVYFSVIENPYEHLRATHKTLLIFTLPTAIVISGILTSITSKSIKLHIDKDTIFLVLFLLSVPYAYAIGTASSYLEKISGAGIFLIAAAMVSTPKLSSIELHVRRTAQIGVSVICVTFLLTHAATNSPYRQPISLTTKASKTDLQALGQNLRLNQQTKIYFEGLMDIAEKNGFTPETPIIDMTGSSPGSLFAIGGKNIGAAWLLGGYDGSDQFAIAGLSRAPKDQLDAAWILTEPDGRRSLSPEILSSIGKVLERDFELLGAVTLPANLGGRRNQTKQFLYKPNSSNP